MGRYISTGIIFQYCFSKSRIEQLYRKLFMKEKAFSDLKQEIIDQLFPEIYDNEEDDEYLYVYLADSVKSEDIVTTMRTFYSVFGMCKDESVKFEEVCNRLKGVTIKEAYKIAQERSSYLYYDTQLGYSYAYYGCPLILEGKKFFCDVHLSVVTIEASSSKTLTEDDISPYDFFTDLLRYRMKPDKLADAMIVFLSP